MPWFDIVRFRNPSVNERAMLRARTRMQEEGRLFKRPIYGNTCVYSLTDVQVYLGFRALVLPFNCVDATLFSLYGLMLEMLGDTVFKVSAMTIDLTIERSNFCRVPAQANRSPHSRVLHPANKSNHRGQEGAGRSHQSSGIESLRYPLSLKTV